MIKNILKKIYDFIVESHKMFYNENYIYDTHMKMRSRL